MTLATLGAAALLALWMIMRGGLKMSKGQTTNILAVVVVVGIVAGAAWFKSQRSEAPVDESEISGNPTPAAQAVQPTAAPDENVADGELCPEPVPSSQPAVAQSADGATPPPADAKLPRLVDLGADKCIPCKKMAPILRELRTEYAGRATVNFIDVWKNPSAGREYGIRVIPTQIFYDREGNEVWRHEGFLSKEAIIAKFKELGAK